jgi:membrane-bound ClpP family serine protease
MLTTTFLIVLAVLAYLVLGLFVLGALGANEFAVDLGPFWALAIIAAWPIILALRPVWCPIAAETDKAIAFSNQALVGQPGTAITDLRPCGKVQIGGDTHPARVESGFLERGSPVTVTRAGPFELLVRAVTGVKSVQD